VDVTENWKAAWRGQHETSDCGRVRHVADADADAGHVSEWFEYDLSGEAYEEFWRRLPELSSTDAAADGSGAAACTTEQGSYELLVAHRGRFGYFRDNRSSALVEEIDTLCKQGYTLDTLLLDESRTLEWRRSIVDCECSTGTCADWRIEQSILPWRVGTVLERVQREVPSHIAVPATFEAVD